MIVEDLIKILENVDPDMEVMLEITTNGTYSNFGSVSGVGIATMKDGEEVVAISSLVFTIHQN